MIKCETLNSIKQVHNAVIELLREVPQDQVAAYSCLIENQSEDLFKAIKDYHSINSMNTEYVKG